MKLKITKKQKRIMDKILVALEKRQQKYANDNPNLFPGASDMPFNFVVCVRRSFYGESLSIDCYLRYSNKFELPYFSASLYQQTPKDVNIEWIWERIRYFLRENWRFIAEDVSKESVYIPLLEKD